MAKPFYFVNQQCGNNSNSETSSYEKSGNPNYYANSPSVPTNQYNNPSANQWDLEQQRYVNAVQMKYIDADIEMWLKNFEYNKKMELERLKGEIAEKRQNTIEKNRWKRETSNKAVFKNSEGKLCFEIITPDGQHTMSRPVITKINLQMTIVYSSVTGADVKFVYINYDGLDKPIPLVEGELSEKGLKKALEKNGIAVRISREQKKDFISLVLAYLIENATWKEVPHTTGWNMMSDGKWVFEKDINKTLGGMFHVL